MTLFSEIHLQNLVKEILKTNEQNKDIIFMTIFKYFVFTLSLCFTCLYSLVFFLLLYDIMNIYKFGYF